MSELQSPDTATAGLSTDRSRKTGFRPVVLGLRDLLGQEYTDALCAARAFLTGQDERELQRIAAERVDFYPASFHERLVSLLPYVGKTCTPPVKDTAIGATSNAFRAASKRGPAPRSCLGYLRLGEDGRLCLASKSAHYHASVGHAFPGYGLIERARQLGVPNATHNNTRGHITRLVEEELVCSAAGITRATGGELENLLTSNHPAELNRVLNLETGSLAVEATVKMVLGRFYEIQAECPEPKYSGRTPVLVVIGDDQGGITANYHGTTVLTQMMRGMWEGLRQSFEEQGAVLIRSVRRDNLDELETLFRAYEKPPYKIAGVFHELLLMNYAACRLSEGFVRRLYALCEEHDVLTVVDEIQTCIWSPEIFMFREYGIKPSAVVLGKGFPGGEFAASRVIFSAAMDNLPQFGALVTNGQEELASLAYLVTLRWAQENAEVTRAVGGYYEDRLRGLADQYPHLIASIEGQRHMAGVYFKELPPAEVFAEHIKKAGMDISVQAYKEGCPPSALTKLPLTVGYEAVDFIIGHMESALRTI